MNSIDWLVAAIRSYQAQTGSAPGRAEVGPEFLRWLGEEAELAALPRASDGRPWSKQDVIDAGNAGTLELFGVRIVLASHIAEVPYGNQAQEAWLAKRITRLERLLRTAEDALRPSMPSYAEPGDAPFRDPEMRTMVVIKAEYDRLRECARIVEGWREEDGDDG